MNEKEISEHVIKVLGTFAEQILDEYINPPASEYDQKLMVAGKGMLALAIQDVLGITPSFEVVDQIDKKIKPYYDACAQADFTHACLERAGIIKKVDDSRLN